MTIQSYGVKERNCVIFVFSDKKFFTAKTWIVPSKEVMNGLELVSYIIHILCPISLYSFLYDFLKKYKRSLTRYFDHLKSCKSISDSRKNGDRKNNVEFSYNMILNRCLKCIKVHRIMLE